MEIVTKSTSEDYHTNRSQLAVLRIHVCRTVLLCGGEVGSESRMCIMANGEEFRTHERLPRGKNPDPVAVKRCRLCRQSLPLTAFERRPEGRAGSECSVRIMHCAPLRE